MHYIKVLPELSIFLFYLMHIIYNLHYDIIIYMLIES